MNDDPYKVAFPITSFPNVKPFDGTVEEFATLYEQVWADSWREWEAAQWAQALAVAQHIASTPPPDFYRWN